MSTSQWQKHHFIHKNEVRLLRGPYLNITANSLTATEPENPQQKRENLGMQGKREMGTQQKIHRAAWAMEKSSGLQVTPQPGRAAGKARTRKETLLNPQTQWHRVPHTEPGSLLRAKTSSQEPECSLSSTEFQREMRARSRCRRPMTKKGQGRNA